MIKNNTFNALVVEKEDNDLVATVKQIKVDDLPEEDVLIQVDYSNLSYREDLGFAKRNKLLRICAMVPGVTLVGTVLESKSSA